VLVADMQLRHNQPGERVPQRVTNAVGQDFTVVIEDFANGCRSPAQTLA
jgi:hypothetical protein